MGSQYYNWLDLLSLREEGVEDILVAFYNENDYMTESWWLKDHIDTGATFPITEVTLKQFCDNGVTLGDVTTSTLTVKINVATSADYLDLTNTTRKIAFIYAQHNTGLDLKYVCKSCKFEVIEMAYKDRELTFTAQPKFDIVLDNALSNYMLTASYKTPREVWDSLLENDLAPYITIPESGYEFEEWSSPLALLDIYMQKFGEKSCTFTIRSLMKDLGILMGVNFIQTPYIAETIDIEVPLPSLLSTIPEGVFPQPTFLDGSYSCTELITRGVEGDIFSPTPLCTVNAGRHNLNVDLAGSALYMANINVLSDDGSVSLKNLYTSSHLPIVVLLNTAKLSSINIPNTDVMSYQFKQDNIDTIGGHYTGGNYNISYGQFLQYDLESYASGAASFLMAHGTPFIKPYDVLRLRTDWEYYTYVTVQSNEWKFLGESQINSLSSAASGMYPASYANSAAVDIAIEGQDIQNTRASLQRQITYLQNALDKSTEQGVIRNPAIKLVANIVTQNIPITLTTTSVFVNGLKNTTVIKSNNLLNIYTSLPTSSSEEVYCGLVQGSEPIIAGLHNVYKSYQISKEKNESIYGSATEDIATQALGTISLTNLVIFDPSNIIPFIDGAYLTWLVDNGFTTHNLIYGITPIIEPLGVYLSTDASSECGFTLHTYGATTTPFRFIQKISPYSIPGSMYYEARIKLKDLIIDNIAGNYFVVCMNAISKTYSPTINAQNLLTQSKNMWFSIDGIL